MSKNKSVSNALEAHKYIYYSPELDELFTLKIKPSRPVREYSLWLQGNLLLKCIVYLGEL